jgi:hypothetical protein
MDYSTKTRLVFMLASAVDTLLGAVALLIYFGILPVDISSWGIPGWVVGFAGAVLFFSGIGIFSYFSTKTDVHE